MRKIEVTINGVAYSSMKEAAQALNVTPATICRHYHCGTLESIMTGKTVAQPVKIEGKLYNSIRAASRDLGINFERLRVTLKENQFIGRE
tara:strand:+ start:1255 stop:1524 length:270 start_codon:yes stop_codon:yes gene_type:complete